MKLTATAKEISEFSATDLERWVRQELVLCPECGELVCTVPAEGVPAQQLRGCPCGAVFGMDMYSVPRYADVNDNSSIAYN